VPALGLGVQRLVAGWDRVGLRHVTNRLGACRAPHGVERRVGF
jgi:hypothetical protein